MNRTAINILLAAVLFFVGARARAQPPVYNECNSLYTAIRDGRISKPEALRQIKVLMPRAREYYNRHSRMEYGPDLWVFPVQGYNAAAIGGKNGSGYIASGYNFFDGNKHGGHPAHDIFIRDKDQDGMDDKTRKPVNVLSVTGGIVVAMETDWDTTSVLRGGKYIWIYEPVTNSLFYYAHNDKVFVRGGDIVKPGDVIATVGRTGLNAYKKRSPTHLHLMQLQIAGDGYPKPVNCYDMLKTR